MTQESHTPFVIRVYYTTGDSDLLPVFVMSDYYVVNRFVGIREIEASIRAKTGESCRVTKVEVKDRVLLDMVEANT